MKKYKLGPYKDGLYRITALRDFADIKAGTIGGFVGTGYTLSHEGECWIQDNAKVYGRARVEGHARIWKNARVYDNVKVFGTAQVGGNAEVSGNAQIYGDARIGGNALVFGSAVIFGNAMVCDNAKVYRSAIVRGISEIFGDAACVSPPIVLDFPKGPITVTDTHITLNHETHIHKYWIKNFKDICKKFTYYSKEEVQTYKLMIFHLVHVKTGKKLTDIIKD